MQLKTLQFSLIILLLLMVQTLAVPVVITATLKHPDSVFTTTLVDVSHYFMKMQEVVSGAVTFRDMQLEYPLAAFPILAGPALTATTKNQYMIRFVLEMMLWNAACFFMVVRWVRREYGRRPAIRAAGWYTLWMGLFTPMWALRIDLPAATLIFASFTWLISRPGLAATIGVLGGYLKLVPLVMVPAAFRQRRSWRAPLLALGLFVVILLMWWLFAQPNMDYAIRYHLRRGIEINSLYSGILYIIGTIAHWPMSTGFHFGSSELSTPIPQLAIQFIPELQVMAVIYPLLRLPTGTNQHNLRLVTAMVLGYIIFGKVLSPQYLLWLIPLYAVISGPLARKQQLIFTAACLLTTLLYPFWFKQLADLQPAIFAVLNLRNGLLLWLYWLAIRPNRETEQQIASRIRTQPTAPAAGMEATQ